MNVQLICRNCVKNIEQQNELHIPGVNFYPLGGAESTAKFDLDISAEVTEEGINFSWVYDQSLFTQAHIENLSEHLNRLLSGMIETPDARLCDLAMLSAEEENYLIHELNDTR